METHRNGSPPGHFHALRFYRSPAELSELVSAFVVAGIVKGQPALVLATAEHLLGIISRLSAGLDVAQLERDGLLVLWDAAETLNRLLVNDRVDHELLEYTVSPVLREISQDGARPIRIYGEMAGLLWERNLWMGASQLEVYTNRIASHQRLLCLCGYDASGFLQDRKGAAHVCGFHTHVLSDYWDEAAASGSIGGPAS